MIGLLIALFLVSIMATTYISAEHLPVAHNLPWGVTGPSSLTTAVQKSTDLEIHQYANQATLEQAPNQGAIYGGFVSQANTVIVSQAASLKASLDLPVAYEKAAKAQGVQVRFLTINKLPPMDPEGVVPIVSVFVLLLAGYLGATMAMQRTKTAARRWRVAALFGYAVVAGLAIDLIAGPLLGGYPNIGTNFWILWPEFVFLCFATALLAATLQSLIGPLGTLITLIVVVFLGNPSTGGANGVAYLPPFLAVPRWRAPAPQWAHPDTQHALPGWQRDHEGGHHPWDLRRCGLCLRNHLLVGAMASRPGSSAQSRRSGRRLNRRDCCGRHTAGVSAAVGGHRCLIPTRYAHPFRSQPG
jgi:hypothetical protein